jgi:hypothetical protein
MINLIRVLTQKVYRSGVWQFEGEVLVPAGTTEACVMQIFGAAPERGRATTLMLQVYDGSLTFYLKMAVFPVGAGTRGYLPAKNRGWGRNLPHGDSGAGTR